MAINDIQVAVSQEFLQHILDLTKAAGKGHAVREQVPD